MSRTMKANEAISALAFLSNPNDLISSASKPSNNIEDNTSNNNNEFSKNDSIGSNLGGRIARAFQRVFSDPNMADLNLSGSVSNTSLQKISNSTKSANDITAVTSSSNSNSCDKGVCFGTVEVRKFPITIGDTPSCSSGLPHTIEWDYLKDETEKYCIDQYERDHPIDERKHGDDLVMDGITRAKMLKNLGYTKQQLLEGMKQVTETKAMANNSKRKSDAKSSRISSAR
jgi:hypothetical protein